MTASEAEALAATLYATGSGSGSGHALRAVVNGEWITFTGGSQGVHSLAWAVSSPARVMAHWSGYAASNGAHVDVVPTKPAKTARQLDAEIAEALDKPRREAEVRHRPRGRKDDAMTSADAKVIASDAEITTTVLSYLAMNPEGMTAKELAKHIGCTRKSIDRVLFALVAFGKVVASSELGRVGRVGSFSPVYSLPDTCEWARREVERQRRVARNLGM